MSEDSQESLEYRYYVEQGEADGRVSESFAVAEAREEAERLLENTRAMLEARASDAQMRGLGHWFAATDIRALCAALGASLKREKKLSEFLQATTATLVAERRERGEDG